MLGKYIRLEKVTYSYSPIYTYITHDVSNDIDKTLFYLTPTYRVIINIQREALNEKFGRT